MAQQLEIEDKTRMLELLKEELKKERENNEEKISEL